MKQNVNRNLAFWNCSTASFSFFVIPLSPRKICENTAEIVTDIGGFMSDKTIIIKLKNDPSVKTIDYLNESYQNKVERFYNVKSNDISSISDLEDDEHYVVFVLYSEDHEKGKPKIEALFIGKGKKVVSSPNDLAVKYGIVYKIDYPLVTNNFISYVALDFAKDFQEKSYVYIEKSKDLIEQLDFIVKPPYSLPPKQVRK
jgi:hypothetical protein